MNNRKILSSEPLRMISAEDALKETKYRVKLKIIYAIYDEMDKRPGSTHCVVMGVIPYDDVIEEFQKEGYTITISDYQIFETNNGMMNLRVRWGE